MKKIKYLLITVFILSSFFVSGQFNKGEVTLSAGASVLHYGYLGDVWIFDNDYSFNLIPPVVFKAEVGIHEYLGIGAFLGFYTRTYKFKVNDRIKDHYNFYSAGGFGSFHFTQLLAENLDIGDLEELDMYISSTLRIEQRVYTRTYYDGTFNQYFTTTETDTYPRFGFGFGLRYYFAENFAIFAEAGTNNLGYFTIGGTLRIQ